ncbi:hypothetical protein [Erwinia rhapontici]|uniref:hypothetical protein n=1 Tax=Erwinia rhapontici TaxID=55212 RepID=UPI003B9DEDBD
MNNIATAAVVIFFASWTSNVMAEQRQAQGSSGIIQFSGRIVESECTHKIQQKQVQVSCERNGQARSSHVSLKSTAQQSLPYNLGTSQIRWLDQQHKLGILMVDYL